MKNKKITTYSKKAHNVARYRKKDAFDLAGGEENGCLNDVSITGKFCTSKMSKCLNQKSKLN